MYCSNIVFTIIFTNNKAIALLLVNIIVNTECQHSHHMAAGLHFSNSMVYDLICNKIITPC